MLDRLKQIPERLLEIWKNWTRNQKIIIVSAIVVFIAAVIVIAYVLSRPTYEELTKCEDYSEMNTVTTLLTDNGYVAAVGMSLGNMVLALTTGKKKYAEYQEEIEELIVKATDLTKRLAECMDKDAESFKPLAAAYGLPKDTEEQIKEREAIMAKALVTASEAPLSMMELILEAMKLIDRISVIGSRIAISDAGVGITMCEAAMKGASLNVFINTKLMKDRELADDMNFKADKLLAQAAQIEEETFGRVMDAVRP